MKTKRSTSGNALLALPNRSRVLRQSLLKWIPSAHMDENKEVQSQESTISRGKLIFHIDSRKASPIATKEKESSSPDFASIFTSLDSHPCGRVKGMGWYSRRIEAQLEDFSVATLPLQTANGRTGRTYLELGTIFLEVARLIQSQGLRSIDSIVDRLVSEGSLINDGTQNNLEARNLVFAMIGWQTMLFKCAQGTCPPQQLAVADEQDGYRGQAFMSLKQSSAGAKRPLHEFLIGFGLLLPPPNFCTAMDPEGKSAFQTFTQTEPAVFNTYLFQSIGHFQIKWVETLSCHLELDERTKTLYLYQYPSFCLACISSPSSDKDLRSVIYALASPKDCSRSWAKEEDVTSMLRETLLSYRLLFGQDKRARKLFKAIDPFKNLSEDHKDHLLSVLCGQQVCTILPCSKDKATYDLRQDFPILRSKLTKLHQNFSASKPRGWKELWNDKRDSAGWLTFWAVIILGGSGILLTFMQVLLQIVQLAFQH